MQKITLYHRGVAVTHYPLTKAAFSVGSHPGNDIVLAGRQVAERQLLLLRSADGRWRVRHPNSPREKNETDLDPGTRIALGPFSLELAADRDPGETQPETEFLSQPSPDPDLVGISPQSRLLRMAISRLGPLGAPVLITGETGTGKELVARGLHRHSPRTSKPFIALNCGSLTPTLLEDRFFGHDRGAFTGANSSHRGVFEQAHGGTLFLDEIGELPPAHQSALLRVLDDGQVSRIGSESYAKVNVRLLAATNRDLMEMVAQNQFRLDLYHRLATLRIATSPLREQPADIGALATHFLAELAEEIGERRLTSAAMMKLKKHSWPGNARELRNVLYRAAALCPAQEIDAGDLCLEPPQQSIRRTAFHLDQVPFRQLKELVAKHEGNIAAAARELGVPRTTLRDRLKRIGQGRH
jgi:DNA-binding NtrC family response regulator